MAHKTLGLERGRIVLAAHNGAWRGLFELEASTLRRTLTICPCGIGAGRWKQGPIEDQSRVAGMTSSSEEPSGQSQRVTAGG